MSIDIQAPRISSEKNPKKVIRSIFQSDLPISGGWGYSKENAVIINKEDPIVSKNIPFDGVSIEYNFVELRIHAELQIFRAGSERCTGIEWNFLKQSLKNHEGRYYDVLFFEVTAISFAELKILEKERKNKDGSQLSKAELKFCIDKKDSKTIRYTTEYWFDISSFYGDC